MFGDKQHGLGKQVLTIAICESKGKKFAASNYFNMSSNFELTIKVTDAFNETTAREFFG